MTTIPPGWTLVPGTTSLEFRECRIPNDNNVGFRINYTFRPIPGESGFDPDLLREIYDEVVALIDERLKKPPAEAQEPCTGEDSCKVSRYVHGCYADDHGICDQPDRHLNRFDPLTETAELVVATGLVSASVDEVRAAMERLNGRWHE